MQIKIENCNNIETGNVEIVENKLNIKYAVNGTGKTTISRAIQLSATAKVVNADGLTALTPFKFRGVKDKLPTVTGAESVKNIKVFDERYINEFVFQSDELIKGSFDIFIKDQSYESGMKEIDILMDEMKKLLSTDKDIDDLIADFGEINANFGKVVKSGIHGSSAIAKAFKDGNKVANIPAGLEGYKSFIQSDINFKWVKWQLDGSGYLDLGSHCPYCTGDIETKRPTIKKVSEVYEPKVIENLNKIVLVFEKLGDYFSDQAKSTIGNFVKSVSPYTDEQTRFLREVNEQVEGLRGKFLQAKTMGFYSLKEVDKVIEALNKYKIDFNYYVHLKSDKTQEKVKIINESIDALLAKAGDLQGKINRQKALIQRLVKENGEGINGFLANAGYKYKVILAEGEDGQHKLKLVHNDVTGHLENVKSHLSFGERNAFSLVLFMFDALRENRDLIILDDPISSFDKNKKYAIIDMMFRGDRSFRDKTVLLLTHDFDPVVDMVLHHADRFVKPQARFLENAKGVLSEIVISREHIKTFIEINEENLRSNIHDISKSVYLRRLYELTNDKSLAYQLISSLLHKSATPTVKSGDVVRDMTVQEIQDAQLEIRKHIPSFDYTSLHVIVMNNSEMKRLYAASGNNFERLHVYRILFDKAELADSHVIVKFINEAFHIENNYIYQLNPREFQTVPQYVIDECDKYIAK